MRFPSYSSEWHSYTLGEILTFYSTNSFSREKLNYDTGSVKNIHYGDIHTKFPSIVSVSDNKDIPFINNEIDLSKYSEDQYLQNGDLIIADASEDYEDIGKAIEVKNIDDEKVLAGLHTILARDNNNITVNGFKAYLFSTNSLKTKIKIIANGISVLGISKNSLSKLTVNVPSKNEQNVVVDFISLIDNKIELLEQKHQYYLDFKKFLMQQIFAQKLRFADDENWVTVTIANIFDNITDYVAAGSFADIRKNVTYLKDPDYAQLIRTADLKSNFTNGDFVYVDKHAFEYLWRVNLDEPCIVLPNIGNIGEVYYINPKELPYSNNALAPNAILLKSNDNIKFKYYLLESPYFKNQLDIINEAGGRGKFNKTNLKKIKIKVPNNDLEKEKIAKCLSNVDNKLKLFNIQLIEMQEFKKGLLQQMFVVRINWRCNFKLAKSPSFNKHLLILKNKIIFIIIK